VAKTKQSTQPEISYVLQKKAPTIITQFSANKQRLLNKEVVYNCVIHDKLPMSRFDSPGFRRSFELVSEGNFKLVHRHAAAQIAQSICDESF
jgi:hypothetical protein